jgi:hypothetical protein
MLTCARSLKERVLGKVVYNNCFGGFGLSHEAVKRYAEIKEIEIYGFIRERGRPGSDSPMHAVTSFNLKDALCGLVHYRRSPEWNDKNDDHHFSDSDIERDDPALVQVVEELGARANGACANLAIENVPTGMLWRIDEYDGNESVMTMGDYSWKVAK